MRKKNADLHYSLFWGSMAMFPVKGSREFVEKDFFILHHSSIWRRPERIFCSDSGSNIWIEGLAIRTPKNLTHTVSGKYGSKKGSSQRFQYLNKLLFATNL